MHYNSANIVPTMTISTKTALQMLDNLSTAVMLFDQDLKLLCINSAGENLLSASHRRLVGQTPREILPRPPVLAGMIERTLNTGQPFTERGLAIGLTNARSVTVDCHVTPIMNGEACARVIVELIDTDSLQKARREENLMLLHDAARESLRGMAHEIRNPLGGIRGAAQLLERELNNGQEGLTEYTRIIIQESDRLRKFLDRMLASDRTITLEVLNIHELLEYVCNLVAAEFDAPVEIARDYDPSLPPVAADREQIIQVLLNVLGNAVQAAGTGGHIWIRTRILRQITLHKKVHRHVVRVDISDDGPGIPPDIAAGIFYPMVSGRPGGTGLGLSIAQSLINAHGGLIEFERAEDRTTFSIYLPTEQGNG